MAALKHHATAATKLGKNIQKLQERVKMFKKNPYRDPKGFRRGGWQLLIGIWRQELTNLQERIASHANELTILQASTTGLTLERHVRFDAYQASRKQPCDRNSQNLERPE